MNYKVDIYDEFSSNLCLIWRIMENECDHYIFQSYDWLYHWYQTIGADYLSIVPCIVVVSDNNKPVALFPFGIRKCLGSKVLEFIGGDQSDYNSPLIVKDYSGEYLSTEIWGIVENFLPAHDIKKFVKLPEFLNQIKNPIFNYWDCKKVDKANSAILPSTWNTYLGNIPTKIKSDSRRRLRKLNEIGKIQFIIGDVKSKDYDKYLSVMFHQKSQRFQNTGARDLFAIENIKMFYSGLRDAIGTKGRIHFSVLLVGKEVVATHWGVVYDSRFYHLVSTYSSDNWNRYSPGRLLLEKLIEWSIVEELCVFDFTIGEESYKKDWCNHEMDIYSMMQLVTINGLLFFIKELLNNSIKKNKITRKYLMKLNKRLKRFRK